MVFIVLYTRNKGRRKIGILDHLLLEIRQFSPTTHGMNWFLFLVYRDYVCQSPDWRSCLLQTASESSYRGPCHYEKFSLTNCWSVITHFTRGFFISGFTENCHKDCDSWFGDSDSLYFHSSASKDNLGSVAFHTNGHDKLDKRLTSVGLR